MKAAVVRSFDRPLEIEDRPIPEPDAGRVLVRIEAGGLCQAPPDGVAVRSHGHEAAVVA